MTNLREVVQSGKDLQMAIVGMCRQELLEQIQCFEHEGFKCDFTLEFLEGQDDGKLQHILSAEWCLVEVKVMKERGLVDSGLLV